MKINVPYRIETEEGASSLPPSSYMLPLYDKLYRVVVNARGNLGTGGGVEILGKLLNTCWDEIVSPFSRFKPDPVQREEMTIPGSRTYNVIKELGFSVPSAGMTTQQPLTEDLKAICSASDWLKCQEEDAAYALEQAVMSSNLAVSDGIVMRVAIRKERLLFLHSVYLLASGLVERKIPVDNYYRLAFSLLKNIIGIAVVLSSLGEPKQSSVSDAVTMALDIYLISDEILYLAGIIFRLHDQLSTNALLDLAEELHNTIGKISDAKYALSNTEASGITSASPVSAPTSLRQAYNIIVCTALKHSVSTQNEGKINPEERGETLRIPGKLYVPSVFTKGMITEMKMSEVLSIDQEQRLLMRQTQGSTAQGVANGEMGVTNIEASNISLNNGLDIAPGITQQNQGVQDQVPAREQLCRNGNFRHSLEYVRWNGITKDEVETKGISKVVQNLGVNPNQNIMIIDELSVKNILTNTTVELSPLVLIHNLLNEQNLNSVDSYILVPIIKFLAMISSALSVLTNSCSPETLSPTRGNKYSVFGVAFGLDEFYNHLLNYEVSDKRTRIKQDKENGEIQSTSATLFHFISAKNTFFGTDGLGSVDGSVSCSIGGELCDVVYSVLHKIIFDIGGGSIVFSLAESEKRIIDKKRANDLETAIEEMREILNSDNLAYGGGGGGNQGLMRTLNALSNNIKETFAGTRASGIGLAEESESAKRFVYPFTVFNLYLTIVCRNRWIRSRISSASLMCLEPMDNARKTLGNNAIPNSTLLSVYLEFCTKKINSVPLYLSSVNLIRTLYGSVQSAASRLAKKILGSDTGRADLNRNGRTGGFSSGAGMGGGVDTQQYKRSRPQSFVELYSEITLNNVINIVDKFLKVESADEFTGMSSQYAGRFNGQGMYGTGRTQNQSGYLSQSGLSGTTIANQFVNVNKFNPRMRNLNLDGLDFDIGNRGPSMRSRLLGVMGEMEDMDEDFLNRDDFLPVVLFSLRFINTVVKHILSSSRHILNARGEEGQGRRTKQTSPLPIDVDKILKIAAKLQAYIDILRNNYPISADGGIGIGAPLTLSALGRQVGGQLSIPSITNPANVNPTEVQLELINMLTRLLDNTLLNHSNMSSLEHGRIEDAVNATLVTTNFKALLKVGAKHAKAVFRFFYAVLSSSIYEESAQNTANAFGTTSSNLSMLTVSSFNGGQGIPTPMYVSANTVVSDVLRDVSDTLGDFYVGGGAGNNARQSNPIGLGGNIGGTEFVSTPASQYTVIHIYLIKFMNKLYRLYSNHGPRGVDVTSFRVTNSQILKNIYKQLLTDYFVFSTCRTSRFFTALCSSIHNYWQSRARDIEINQMNRINQINRINQLSAANQMSQANQISDMNTANAINTIKTVNAINNFTRTQTMYNPISGINTPYGMQQMNGLGMGFGSGGNLLTPGDPTGMYMSGFNQMSATPMSNIGMQNQTMSQTVPYDPLSASNTTLDIGEIAFPMLNISTMLSNSSSFEEAAEAYVNIGVKELFKFTVCEMERANYISGKAAPQPIMTSVTNASIRGGMSLNGQDNSALAPRAERPETKKDEQNELLAMLMTTDVTLPLMYPIVIDDRLEEQSGGFGGMNLVDTTNNMGVNTSTAETNQNRRRIEQFKAASCLPCNINGASCSVPTVILLTLFGLVPDTSLWLLKNDKSMTPTEETDKGYVIVASSLDAKNADRVARFVNDSLRIGTTTHLAQLLKSANNHSANLNLIAETINSINEHIAHNNDILNSEYSNIGTNNALNALGVNANTAMGNGLGNGFNNGAGFGNGMGMGMGGMMGMNGMNNMNGMGGMNGLNGMGGMQQTMAQNSLDTIGKLSQLNNNLNLITIESNAMNNALQNTNTSNVAINSISTSVALGSVIQFLSKVVSDVVKSPLDLIASYKAIGHITHDEILEGGVTLVHNNSLSPTFRAMHALKSLYDFYVGFTSPSTDSGETGPAMSDGKDCVVACNTGLYKFRDVIDLTCAVLENFKLLPNLLSGIANEEEEATSINSSLFHRTVKMFKYSYGILSGLTICNSTTDVVSQLLQEGKGGLRRRQSDTNPPKKMLIDVLDDGTLKDNLRSLYQTLSSLVQVDHSQIPEFNPSSFSNVLYCAEHLVTLTSCKLLRLKAKGVANTDLRNRFDATVRDLLGSATSVHIYPSVIAPVIHDEALKARLAEELNNPRSVLRMTEIESDDVEHQPNESIGAQRIASIAAPLAAVIVSFFPDFEGIEAFNGASVWLSESPLVNEVVERLQTRDVAFLSALYIKLIAVIFRDELYDFSLDINANGINGINAGASPNTNSLPDFLEVLKTGSENILIGGSRVDMLELVKFALRRSRKGYEEISVGLVNQYLIENYNYYPAFLKSKRLRLKQPANTCLFRTTMKGDHGNDCNYLRLLALVRMTNHRMRVVDAQRRSLNSWSVLAQIAFTAAIEKLSALPPNTPGIVQSKLSLAVGALAFTGLVVRPLANEKISEEVVEAAIAPIPKILGQTNMLIASIPLGADGGDNTVLRKSARELSSVLLQAFESLCQCIVERSSVHSESVSTPSLLVALAAICQTITQLSHVSVAVSRLLLDRLMETEFQHIVQSAVDTALLGLRLVGSVEVLSFFNSLLLLYIVIRRPILANGGGTAGPSMPMTMDQVHSILSKFLGVFRDMESRGDLLTAPAISAASELLDLILKFTHIGFATVLVRLDDLYSLVELLRRRYKSSDGLDSVQSPGDNSEDVSGNQAATEGEVAKSLIVAALLSNNNNYYSSAFFEDPTISADIKYSVINTKVLQVFQSIISSQFNGGLQLSTIDVGPSASLASSRSSYVQPSAEQLTKHVLESSLFNKMFLYFNSTRIAPKSVKVIRAARSVRATPLTPTSLRARDAVSYFTLVQANAMLQIYKSMDATQLHMDADTDLSFALLGPHLASTASKLLASLVSLLPTTASVVVFVGAGVAPSVPRLPVLRLIATSLSFLALRTEAVFDDILGSYVLELEKKSILRSTEMEAKPSKRLETKAVTISMLYGLCFYAMKEFQSLPAVDNDTLTFLRDESELLSFSLEKSCSIIHKKTLLYFQLKVDEIIRLHGIDSGTATGPIGLEGSVGFSISKIVENPSIAEMLVEHKLVIFPASVETIIMQLCDLIDAMRTPGVVSDHTRALARELRSLILTR